MKLKFEVSQLKRTNLDVCKKIRNMNHPVYKSFPTCCLAKFIYIKLIPINFQLHYHIAITILLYTIISHNTCCLLKNDFGIEQTKEHDLVVENSKSKIDK